MRRVRGRLKSPDPQKESRWQQELPCSGIAPVPPSTPPTAPIQPVSRKPSGCFEVKECLNAGLVHTAPHITVPADSSAVLPISLTHVHRQASTIHVYGSHCSIVAFYKHLTDNNQNKKTRRGEQQQHEEENSDHNKLKSLSEDKSRLLKTSLEICVWLF
ncbi:hypothetical protein JOB18_003140 [Solea senegalensis]|uniref:Uncharacterized protein n=1 Tax=Solea senegalensis TaxID=28829 RepID=A0AAV6SM65_SOLSE|nr:hypothetical protein JOB18_003140 [Solea senegalensis]